MAENASENSLNHDKDTDHNSEDKKEEESVRKTLRNLQISDLSPQDSTSLREKIIQNVGLGSRDMIQASHKFWDTQLVSKFTDVVTLSECGPIDSNCDVERIKKNPYPLPEGFEWANLDITEEEDRNKVYNLLSENYVEDGDSLFRFDYKPEFMVWALTPPNYNKEWQLGVRISSSKRLVGYITGIPVNLNVMGKQLKVAEVNFLCIHKKLRSKRLAPVLIKEITRRVNLCGIWQAVYTAGIVIPKPIARCRYWHRPLDIKRLIAARFSGVGRRMTISRAIRIYRVNEMNVEMRLMEKKDVSSLFKLLKDSMSKFKIYQEFTLEEVQHIFMPRDDIVQTFVKSVNGENIEFIRELGNVTDMLSFYSLPSTVINNKKVHTIRAAYSFYNVATTMTFKRLIEHAIYFAKNQEFDVYNALDLMENRQVFEDLKFGMGDGDLHYYMFNYRVPDMNPSDIGIVLL